MRRRVLRQVLGSGVQWRRRSVTRVDTDSEQFLPDLATTRVAYGTETVQVPILDETSIAATWHEQLTIWLSDAAEAGLVEPNAMVLATADAGGRPASRTVLCKGLDDRGVVFYTNRTSAKSHHLSTTPYASATFPMYAMQRQVHVRGVVEFVSEAETAAYWATRWRGSQLGAWASAQSAVIGSREALERALAEVTRRYADVEHVPVPPHWGGTRIVAETVEFWQGRRDRMHDRLRFRHRRDRNDWVLERLQP